MAGWPLVRPKPPKPRKIVKEAPPRQPTYTPITGEISFTTSEYGRFIPIVFGSDKLTGNVIWSGGFNLNTFTADDGEVLSYTTTSFALALCEGVIQALLRLWVGERLVVDNTMKVDADGFPIPNDKGVIAGAQFDLTEEDSPLRKIASGQRLTRITVFNGSETQIPSGIMASVEGFASTPAYRGLAYILFENFLVTENTIPAIMAEVASNANTLFPRLYGTLPDTDYNFNRPYTNVVTYDPSYDMYTIAARDIDGSGTIPNGRGYVTFRGNNLSRIAEHEVYQTQGFQYTASSGSFYLSSGKHLLIRNGGDVAHIFNPFTGMIEGAWGPPPTSFNIHQTGIPTYRRGACTFVLSPGEDQPPTDIMFALSFVSGGSNRAYALVSIDELNQFKLLYASSNTFFQRGPGGVFHSAPVFIDDEFASVTPTFVDGVASAGQHILVTGTTENETEQIDIYRITVSGAGSLEAPNHARIAEISCANIGGVGYAHDIEQVFIDPEDNCLVIICGVSGGRSSRIFKFNPFTGAIVWNSPCSIANSSNIHGNNQQIIINSKFCFMNNTGRVQSVDLSTGEVSTVINALSEQQLPPKLSDVFQKPYYNGLDNSITYISNVPGRHLVKVFIDRTDRTTVPVADIVKNLLDRVGVSEYELDVSDLSALSLRGYTVNGVKSLRTIFADLSQVFTFDIVESNGKIVYKARGENSIVTIPQHHLAPYEDGYLIETHENELGRTRKINLTYRDIFREYDQNVQSVFFSKYNDATFDDDMAIDVSIPVVLDSTTAKKLAEVLLYAKIVGEQTYQGVLRPQYAYLDPGDVITIDTETGPAVIRLRHIERGNDRTIKFRGTKEDPDIYNDQIALFGNFGRFIESEITVPDPRVDPVILEIPFRSDSEAASTDTSYLTFFTVLNYNVTEIPLMDMTLNIVGTDNTDQITVPAPLSFPTWGTTLTKLPYRSSYFSTDYDNVLRVKMMSVLGASIGSVSKDTLLTLGVTCNLACVGGELIQFESAVNEGNDVWAFYGLQRCRLGTEIASTKHAIGERFILLGNPDGSLDEFSIGVAHFNKSIGQRSVVEITVNNNNPFQPSPIFYHTARNLEPWAPSSFKTEYDGDDMILTWKRRLRYDGQYLDDGLEAYPLHEAPEEYTFYLYTDPNTFDKTKPTTYLRSATLASSKFIYTAEMATEDGVDIYRDQLYCRVSQNGTAAGFDAGVERQFKIARKEV